MAIRVLQAVGAEGVGELDDGIGENPACDRIATIDRQRRLKHTVGRMRD
jgi:hypothetical protein